MGCTIATCCVRPLVHDVVGVRILTCQSWASRPTRYLVGRQLHACYTCNEPHICQQQSRAWMGGWVAGWMSRWRDPIRCCGMAAHLHLRRRIHIAGPTHAHTCTHAVGRAYSGAMHAGTCCWAPSHTRTQASTHTCGGHTYIQ